MKRIVAMLVFGAVLSACSSDPEVRRVDVGATPEKAVLAALTKVQASKEQRIAVLNAYDSRNGTLEDLDRSSKRLIAQWYKLDRTAPDYLQQINTLAAQWAQVNGDEMKARGAYEHELAANLSSSQWSQWQDFMINVAAARRHAEFVNDENIRRY